MFFILRNLRIPKHSEQNQRHAGNLHERNAVHTKYAKRDGDGEDRHEIYKPDRPPHADALNADLLKEKTDAGREKTHVDCGDPDGGFAPIRLGELVDKKRQRKKE